MGELRSMTGFASREMLVPGGKVILEGRSVNHKGLDVKVGGIRSLEEQHRIEAAVRAAFRRGRITLTAHFQPESGLEVHLPQGFDAQLLRLRSDMQKLVEQGALPQEPDSEWYLHTALRDKDSVSEALVPAELLSQFCAALLADRQREGAVLAAEFRRQGEAIQAAAGQVEGERESEEELMRTAWRQRMQNVLEDFSQADAGRIAIELAATIVRGDIREELVRLRAHVDYLLQMLSAPAAVLGHQMDILGQEILREANTLCSKVQSVAAKETAMRIRVLADQFREQVANVE